MTKETKTFLLGAYTLLVVLFSISTVVRWLLPTSTTTVIVFDGEQYACTFKN